MCNTEGEPKPQVKWKKNGIEINVENQDFIILDTSNSVESTSIVYSCTASNAYGFVTQDSLVDVVGKRCQKAAVQR